MRLIFLYGLPATGKLTVAQHLAEKTGYKLFHNHLVVDMLLAVFEFGSEAFVALREDIWLAVLEEAASTELPGIIFTFSPENTVSVGFVEQVRLLIQQGGGELTLVELTAPMEEIKRRLNDASRYERGKLVSVELFERLHAQGAFDSPRMPVPSMTIDTSHILPPEAAARIFKHLSLPHCA